MPLNPSTSYSHWVKHGDRLIEPMWEAGSTINYDGYGLMMFNGTLKIRDAENPTTLETSGLPGFGDEVFKGSGLFVSKMSKRYNADKTISVDIEAVGIEARCKGQTRIAVEGMNVTASEPIETHPDFKTKLAGTPSKRMNGATFDKEGRFTGFAVEEQLSATGAVVSNANSVNSLAGVRSYLAPKQTVRGYFHIAQKTLELVPDWLERMIGLTTTSGQIMSFKLLPDFMIKENGLGTGSWLLTSINPENVVIDRDGKPMIVKVTFEMMRAKTAWNSLIYIKGD